MNCVEGLHLESGWISITMIQYHSIRNPTLVPALGFFSDKTMIQKLNIQNPINTNHLPQVLAFSSLPLIQPLPASVRAFLEICSRFPSFVLKTYLVKMQQVTKGCTCKDCKVGIVLLDCRVQALAASLRAKPRQLEESTYFWPVPTFVFILCLMWLVQGLQVLMVLAKTFAMKGIVRTPACDMMPWFSKL